MNQDFEVSVVMPVYNSAQFIRRSVAAVLDQQDVAELILVEDASPDGSLEICEQLASENARVRLVRHPDKLNHGAAETRNLGIRSAKCEYLAFADSDNFYLPNRFAADREILLSDASVDGVYNAQGVHYDTEAAREAFHRAGLGGGEFLSVSAAVPPDEFWKVMLGSHPTAKIVGGLGIDAITLRRACISKIGLFDPSLRLMQDVHFFVRMAVKARMAGGVIDRPVAVRGVHGQMRSTDPETMTRYRRECWTSLKSWFDREVSDPSKKLAFEKAFFFRSAKWSSPSTKRANFFKIISSHPSLLLESYGFFDLGLLDSFGSPWLLTHGVSFKRRLVEKLLPNFGVAGNSGALRGTAVGRTPQP